MHFQSQIYENKLKKMALRRSPAVRLKPGFKEV
jgi:hypothetical protein